MTEDILISLTGLCRIGVAQPFAEEIHRALGATQERLRQLTAVEQMHRVEQAAKRPLSMGEAGPSKRPRVDESTASVATISAEALKTINWKTVDRRVVTDLVVANLQAFSDEDVLKAITVSFSYASHDLVDAHIL